MEIAGTSALFWPGIVVLGLGVGYLAGGHLIGIGQGVLVLPMLVDIHGRDLSRGVVLVR